MRTMQMPALVSLLRTCVLAAAAAGMVSSNAGAQALSGNDLVNTLRQGGYMIVMRHANSPQTRPDATTAAPGNTGLERQLNENGHKTARAMGEALKTLRIPVGEVLSSPTFRTLETVRDVGLGAAKTYNELGDGSPEYPLSSYEDGARFMRARAAEVPRAGTNTFIVTHLPNIEYGFGDSFSDVAEGEAVVVRPDGTNGTPVGRIKIDEWPRLAGGN
jgi:phosphohistidine phosphatase SixA